MKYRNLLAGLVAIAGLSVATHASATIMLAVDLEGGATEAGSFVTEAGFVSLNALGASAVGQTFSTSETGINATIGATGAAGFLAGRNGSGQDRGGPLANLTQEGLHGDVIAARGGNGGFSIQLTGLTINDIVTLTSWHNEANGGNSGFATVGASMTPSIVSGGALISATPGQHTNLSRPGTATFSGPYTDADLRPSVISFTATSATVDLLLTSGSANLFAPVSGFTVDVVPEPSTFALLGLGAACFMLRRRRS